MAAKNTQESFLTSHDRQTLIFGLPLSSSEKFVLTALNAFVGSDGRCWPGIERLSKMTSLEVKTVRKVLARLRESGIVRSESRFDSSGRQTSNLYFVDFSRAEQIGGAKLGGCQKRPPQNDPREGTKNSPPGGTKIGGRTNPKEVTIEKEEEEEFFNSDSMSNAEEDDRFELSVTASNPEEDPTPLPPAPSRDMLSAADKLIQREKAKWGGNGPTRSGANYLYPWNVNKDPRAIDPEFAAYLVAKQVPWIHYNFDQRKGLDEETVIAHCRKLIDMDKRVKFEPDLMEAWKKFAADRAAIAAIREERAKSAQANDPENNVAYKRLEAALNRFPDRFQIEVNDHDWHSLRIDVRYKGTLVMQGRRLSHGVFDDLIAGMCRVGGKVFTRQYMAKALGLEDWDDLFPDSIVAGREAA